MIIRRPDGKELDLEQIQALVKATQPLDFRGQGRQGMYEWIPPVLRQQSYRTHGKPARGLLRRYLETMTGCSRAQVTRSIARYLVHSEVKEFQHRRHPFANRFTPTNIELLAEVDEAHETLSGPATKKILEREFALYKHAAHERLATTSVAHI